MFSQEVDRFARVSRVVEQGFPGKPGLITASPMLPPTALVCQEFHLCHHCESVTREAEGSLVKARQDRYSSRVEQDLVPVMDVLFQETALFRRLVDWQVLTRQEEQFTATLRETHCCFQLSMTAWSASCCQLWSS
jgi:hypothetical protein